MLTYDVYERNMVRHITSQKRDVSQYNNNDLLTFHVCVGQCTIRNECQTGIDCAAALREMTRYVVTSRNTAHRATRHYTQKLSATSVTKVRHKAGGVLGESVPLCPDVSGTITPASTPDQFRANGRRDKDCCLDVNTTGNDIPV